MRMRFIGACLIAVGLWMFLSSVLAAPWDMKLVGGLFFGGMVYVGWLIYRIPAKKQQKNETALANLPEVKGADYKHIFNTSAIALNKGSQTLFLADGHTRKTYSFADVRKWSYEVLSGGGVVGGGGLQQVAINRQVNQANRDGSGFFVEVRDIDHPKWQIKFEHDSKMETELLRWMEILRQYINEK
jgi:hypothetical protein